MIDDPIVAEVRAIRAKLLEECDGDLGKLAKRVHRETQKLGFKTVRLGNRRRGSAANEPLGKGNLPAAEVEQTHTTGRRKRKVG
jgi:hypothetical protein